MRSRGPQAAASCICWPAACEQDRAAKYVRYCGMEAAAQAAERRPLLSPGRFHVWLDCTQRTTNYYSLAACTAALGSEMAQLLSVICPSVEHGCAVPSLLRSPVSRPRAACLRRPTISAWALQQPGPSSPFLASSNNNRSSALSGSWSIGVSLLPRPHSALNR